MLGLLHRDALFLILKELPLRDLRALQLTCKQFHAAVANFVESCIHFEPEPSWIFSGTGAGWSAFMVPLPVGKTKLYVSFSFSLVLREVRNFWGAVVGVTEQDQEDLDGHVTGTNKWALHSSCGLSLGVSRVFVNNTTSSQDGGPTNVTMPIVMRQKVHQGCHDYGMYADFDHGHLFYFHHGQPTHQGPLRFQLNAQHASLYVSVFAGQVASASVKSSLPWKVTSFF